MSAHDAIAEAEALIAACPKDLRLTHVQWDNVRDYLLIPALADLRAGSGDSEPSDDLDLAIEGLLRIAAQTLPGRAVKIAKETLRALTCVCAETSSRNCPVHAPKSSPAGSGDSEPEERWYVPCGCDHHGDHLGCEASCKDSGCQHPLGVDVSAATEQEADNHVHGPNCWLAAPAAPAHDETLRALTEANRRLATALRQAPPMPITEGYDRWHISWRTPALEEHEAALAARSGSTDEGDA